ncbi:hypothetical protein N7489_008582 [Penicillium chrysogenum]|jgi:hypothetical protein|uniref:Uncharacterized protein n=1 Tax=Penicillium chrysogenum TaxID=5076 RepID=A0ABQ8X0Y8_PENCH|nr:uncharacterized protein N7489_008582 [Penicillium chrysogenum]KAJ5227874.1 hypothetical protein N7489_008582 [Penicillium chrysogenum]KAJ5284494.1 hypothetical protein N7505_002474 [Penicillium chrysogenum]KAJ5286401.1 hypothetical protein N7524_001707 [Penicillium chrysogenum]KAJ6167377.1 hypothetical protein N7497_000220 [Penicillium chrysogenum]
MEDALRPSKEAFEYTLRASHQLWSTYFETSDTRLPLECIDLKSILKDTPAYLADGLIASDKAFSFACAKTRGNLDIKGQLRWRTSRAGADCMTPPKVIPLDLRLGVPEARKVEISNEAPLSEWPGVRGISGYDEGNHIAVLFLAWAYILSAKWAELLDRSETHQCSTKYSETCQDPAEAVQPEVVEVDLPPDASEAEIVWWNAVLSGTPAWEISVEYQSEKFASPWSVSLGGAISMRAKQGTHPHLTTYNPPPSTTAFQYLLRFCNHHLIYAQCTAALSASFFTRNFCVRNPPTLPIPRPAKTPEYQSTPASPQSISALLSEHEKLLPYYMTLSSNMWLTTMPAIKTLFFNPDIPCNLVSSWKNPAFAIINPLVKQGNIPHLLNGLSARQPRTASLWLGAAIMGRSSVFIKQCEQGMMMPSLQSEAWMGTPTTFLTQLPRIYDNDADSVQREDECKLLFLATPTDGGYNHGYLTSWPWKPFGSTKLRDVDLLLREHLGCGCHALEYEGWDWELGDGSRIEDAGVGAPVASLLSASNCASASAPVSMCVSCPKPGVTSADLPALPADCEYDLYSEGQSDNPTRGIFCWLRLDGFPANEKGIYQHSWVEMDSDEEIDEHESGDSTANVRVERIEYWLGGVNDIEAVVEVESEDCRDTA